MKRTIIIFTFCIFVIYIISFTLNKETKQDSQRQFPEPITIIQQDIINTPYIELLSPTDFINTEAFTLKELIGKKVILLDFISYSSLDDQTDVAYLNAWHNRYKDQGLSVIAIHIPEFDFQKDPKKVLESLQVFGADFPIVLDNNKTIMESYRITSTPTKFLIDINGNIVHKANSDEDPELTEYSFQRLLINRLKKNNDNVDNFDFSLTPINPSNQPIEPFATFYLGALKNTNLGNPVDVYSEYKTFRLPSTLKPDLYYLSGEWDVTPDYIQALSSGSQIVTLYQGKNVYMLAGSETESQARISRHPLEDTSVQSEYIKTINVSSNDTYQIIKNKESGIYILEITATTGLKVYNLSFE